MALDDLPLAREELPQDGVCRWVELGAIAVSCQQLAPESYKKLARRCMTSEDRQALRFARSWLRRDPGPDAWANLAAVHATKQPRNLARARYWYRRAALKGHDRGLFEYGLMLIDGEGGPKVATAC
jgi:TPR repeat protein